MNKPKIEVCKGDKNYFLRIHFFTDKSGTIRMETGEEFSKREADYCAVILAADNGWDRDELPTQNKVAVYPRKEYPANAI